MATSDKTPKDTTAIKKVARVESYDIAKSDETLDLAKDLAKFIKDNKLSTQVQGKEFVNVEGWQYAGSRLGIVPIVEHVINCSTDQELKYQAKVTLFDMRSQHTVGVGFAICSNKESGRKFYQEFAIASMAQTRAIGKAYRNILAWIIRAAGYEPTPAEEMEYSGNVPTPVAQPAPATAEPAPVMRAVTSTPAPDAAEVVYASYAQKSEIVRLLNHELVTREEKTKMLLNINRLDEERATTAIAKLNKAIVDRGGNPEEATLGNAPAGETPAEQPSAAPVASTTSAPSNDAQNEAQVQAVLDGATLSSYTENGVTTLIAHFPNQPAPVDATVHPALAAFGQRFALATSTIEVKEIWEKELTSDQKRILGGDKEAAKLRIARAVLNREDSPIRAAGDNSELVDEFCKQPVTPGVEFVQASQEQQDAIMRLLDHPLIVRKEKTQLLLYVKKLDKNRARLALLKLRRAIAEREGVDPLDGARATVKAFVLRHQGQLSNAQADELNALAVSPEATLEFLLDAVDLAQAALVADGADQPTTQLAA